MTEKDLSITKGSKYSVTFGRSETIIGTFSGYAVIGSETAVVMDVEGSVTYILSSKILTMTLVGPSSSTDTLKKEDPGVYYG